MKPRPRFRIFLVWLGVIWLLCAPGYVIYGQIQHQNDLATITKLQRELNQRDKNISTADKELADFAVWLIGTNMVNHQIGCMTLAVVAPGTLCPALPPLPTLPGVTHAPSQPQRRVVR